ncbi:MAG: agmatinase [Desulfovermiculus sp.]|nr:agmatinase [Desulfovermiculus sp.]
MLPAYLNLDSTNGQCISVWPVPYEGTVSFGRGTSQGPEAIIRASAEIETWDQDLGVDLADLAHFSSLPCFEPPVSGPEDVFRHMEEELTSIWTPETFVLTLGGEHSVALAPIRGYQRLFPDLAVVQIDAHADLRESFQGSPYSHASVMARVREADIPLAQIGIRSLCREESQRIARESKQGLMTLFAHDLPSPEQAAAQVREFIGERSLYISFDADGLDPSIMPGTGTPEPGGLSFSWLSRFWPLFFGRCRLVGMDFCELSPLPAAGVVSESVAVRCINRILTSYLNAPAQL